MDFWTFVSNRRLRADPLGDYLYQIKVGEIAHPPEPTTPREFKTILERARISSTLEDRNRVWSSWRSRRLRSTNDVEIRPGQNCDPDDGRQERNAQYPESELSE